MGIYESRSTSDHEGSSTGEETFLERIDPGYGEIITRLHVVTVVKRERLNCWCCSCRDDRPGGDAACRNHGFAAERPCEVHGMPGSPWSRDYEEPGFIGPEAMPESVQAVRRQQEEWEKAHV